MSLSVACDGSSLNNPGPAGWAWYLNEDCWQSGGWAMGTNNQAELSAVLALLQAARAHPLEILCDSRYVIDSLTKWRPRWKSRGWRKAGGDPVLNVEILKELDQRLSQRSDITFRWVRGHTGDPLNEKADFLARSAAQAYARGRQPNFGPGWTFSGSD